MTKINIQPDFNNKNFDKYQDFDNVLKGVKNNATTPNENTPKINGKSNINKFLSIIITTVVVTTAVWLWNNASSLFSGNNQIAEETSNITKDSSNIANNITFSDLLPVDTLIANIVKDSACIVENKNVQIIIPPNTLVDENNVPVTGNVKLLYQKYTTPAEVALSGIPMHYDSAETTYEFRSGGMFQLRAYQKSRDVRIADNKNIEVMFNSDLTTNGSQYFYNEKTKNWELYTNEQLAIQPNELHLPKKGSQKNTIASEKTNPKVEKIKSEITRVPKKENTENISFNINFSENEFPELKGFKNLSFELYPNQNYSPDYAKEQWQDVTIEKATKGYMVCFKKQKYENGKLVTTKQLCFNTYPVYANGDKVSERKSKALLTSYKKQLKEITKQKAREEAERKKQEAKYANLMERRNKKLARLREKQKQRIAETEAMMKFSKTELPKIYRVFEINNFGIWNCDRAVAGNNTTISVLAYDKQGNFLNFRGINVVNKNQKVIVSYPSHNVKVSNKDHYRAYYIDHMARKVFLSNEFNVTSPSEIKLTFTPYEPQEFITRFNKYYGRNF